MQLEAVTTIVYSSYEAPGITALVVAGAVSLLAILILAAVMVVKAWQAWRYGGGILPQTHVAPYFVSLLLANGIQSLGSVMNVEWLGLGGTVYDTVCVGQAVMKNIGNVGTSLWSLIIAFHAFDVLFLRRTQRKLTLWATVIGTWAFIICIDMFGPVVLQKQSQGPFFGISGYWCWITAEYPHARIFLEYIFMFMSAFLCAIMHSVVFLRLRGNLSGEGWRSIRFRRIPRSDRWALKLARDELDSRMYKVASQLMWYPLIYTMVIIPIAVARFVDFAGHDVPFWLTITADFFFNLNGFFNVLLFAATYRRIPLTYLPSLSAPRKSLHLTNYGITPFVLPNPDEINPSEPPINGQPEGDIEKGELSPDFGPESHRASMASYVSADSIAPLNREKE